MILLSSLFLVQQTDEFVSKKTSRNGPNKQMLYSGFWTLQWNLKGTQRKGPSQVPLLPLELPSELEAALVQSRQLEHSRTLSFPGGEASSLTWMIIPVSSLASDLLKPYLIPSASYLR